MAPNDGFANFKQLLISHKKNTRGTATILYSPPTILGSLSYKVCSNPSPKFVVIEQSLLISGESAMIRHLPAVPCHFAFDMNIDMKYCLLMLISALCYESTNQI